MRLAPLMMVAIGCVPGASARAEPIGAADALLAGQTAFASDDKLGGSGHGRALPKEEDIQEGDQGAEPRRVELGPRYEAAMARHRAALARHNADVQAFQAALARRR